MRRASSAGRVRRCSSLSTSFVLAGLRALQVDNSCISGADRRRRGNRLVVPAGWAAGGVVPHQRTGRRRYPAHDVVCGRDASAAANAYQGRGLRVDALSLEHLKAAEGSPGVRRLCQASAEQRETGGEQLSAHPGWRSAAPSPAAPSCTAGTTAGPADRPGAGGYLPESMAKSAIRRRGHRTSSFRGIRPRPKQIVGSRSLSGQRFPTPRIARVKHRVCQWTISRAGAATIMSSTPSSSR